MQISQLNASSGLAPGLPGSSASAEAGAVDATRPGSDAPAQLAPAGSGAAPLRRGLSNWNHQLQGQIASAQQALDYLEQSASQLQALKSELLAKLDARPGRDGQVEARVRQFSDTWRARQEAAGGTLDAQLNYTDGEQATQRFRIRGLTMANLQAGGKEVLAFSVGGANGSLRSVSIEPGLSEQEIVQRFDQALAPANIRVSLSESEAGALVFSTPESAWGTVRDTLAVRGSGIRFPTGQLNRVKTDEEAPALAPEGWGGDDADALQRTLREVEQALARVRQAREAVKRALAQAASAAGTAQPVDLAAMERLAQNFSDTASRPDYTALLSVTATLAGITRERVVSLLSLR